jgi:hypothetical protein
LNGRIDYLNFEGFEWWLALLLILRLQLKNFFQKESVDLFQSQVFCIERRIVDSLDGRGKSPLK